MNVIEIKFDEKNNELAKNFYILAILFQKDLVNIYEVFI